MPEAWLRLSAAIRRRMSRTPARPALTREAIAALFLDGEGIEIGALHKPLAVPPRARVRYVDRMDVAALRRQYVELAELPLVEVDILDDGERLATIADGSQAFVIANHFLEHCQDPIGALGHLLRVTRPGGAVYLAVPDKRHCFDRDRPLTTLEHLRRDHEEGPAWSKRQHFEEWCRLVNRRPTEDEVQREADHLIAMDYSIHYHVWTASTLLAFLAALAGDLSFEVALFSAQSEENIVVLRRM
jgi:SAM-dependent methyltransferase